MLADTIRNMDSMESVTDLVDDIVDRTEGNATELRGGGGGGSPKSAYYMSVDKVEAASRAAAAVLSGGGGDNCGSKAATADGSPAAATASTANSTAAASRLLERTARDIMASGSNGDDSAVISSPSGHSREDSRLSHESPESFLLDVSFVFVCVNVCVMCYIVSFFADS